MATSKKHVVLDVPKQWAMSPGRINFPSCETLAEREKRLWEFFAAVKGPAAERRGRKSVQLSGSTLF